MVDLGRGPSLLQIGGSSYLELAVGATSSESSSLLKFIPWLSLLMVDVGPTRTVARSNQGGGRISCPEFLAEHDLRG